MKLKWHLFNFFIPQKVLMRRSVSNYQIYSEIFQCFLRIAYAGFIWEKLNYIFRSSTQILWSDEIYALCVWFGNMFTNFTYWFIARTAKIFLWLSPACPLNSSLFKNLLLEHSQKLYCVAYPSLPEDEFTIKCY